MDKFTLIAFTPEIPRNDEVEWIKYILFHPTHVISRVHLRHPGYDIDPILKSSPSELLDRITIHDQPELLKEYPALGFHFNTRNPFRQLPGNGLRSMSCHSPKELVSLSELDYVTLSPVFDSISKPGYAGVPELITTDFKSVVPVFALGGITPDNLSELKGFSGAAMLGALNVPLNSLSDILLKIKNIINDLCSSL